MNLPKLLLAEDDPSDEELFRLALEKANIACDMAVVRDGAEVIEYLFGRQDQSGDPPRGIPDLIVLDLKMPRMDGLKVLRMLSRVRGQSFFLPPIVVFTSSDQPQDLEEAYGHGAHSFVQKPVNFGRFVETVQQTIVYWLSINRPRPRHRSGRAELTVEPI